MGTGSMRARAPTRSGPFPKDTATGQRAARSTEALRRCLASAAKDAGALLPARYAG